jgi:hypothetical protein
MTVARWAFATLGIGLFTACSGPQHPWSREEACTATKSADQSVDNDWELWVQLLLRGYDKETHRATSPAIDCTGAQVKWDAPALACNDTATARAQLPDKPITEADVVVNQITPELRLVWVITNRFASGDALGPAAIVEIRPTYIIVRAVGPLRANAQRVKLRLEKLGKTEALIAEGEQCASKDPASCVKAARLLPYWQRRFMADLVSSEGGTCLQPTLFYLAREESSKLESGWRRRFRLTGALLFDPQGFMVQEELVAQDYDPKSPTTPPQTFRKAHSDQTVRLVEGRLVGDKPSLWTKMRSLQETP